MRTVNGSSDATNGPVRGFLSPDGHPASARLTGCRPTVRVGLPQGSAYPMLQPPPPAEGTHQVVHPARRHESEGRTGLAKLSLPPKQESPQHRYLLTLLRQGLGLLFDLGAEP